MGVGGRGRLRDARLRDRCGSISLDLVVHRKFGPALQKRHISVSCLLVVENNHSFLTVWKLLLVYRSLYLFLVLFLGLSENRVTSLVKGYTLLVD